jgi:thiamine biosynthesis lipoprotein
MKHCTTPAPLIFFIITSCFLAGCSEKTTQETHRTILKFGTLIEITLYDVEKNLAEKTLDKLEEDFYQYHENWTPWEESALSRVNKLLKTGETFSVPRSVLPLIEQSISLSKTSQGLFNPAIGELIRLWQFHKHDDPNIQPPDKQLITSLVNKNPTMANIELEGTKLHCNNSSAQLNFGAFAKGYAIDLSLQYLKTSGVKNAIINAGGDLGVIGSHGDRPWKIGIRHPRKDEVIAWLEVRDNENVFTSGDYERFYFHNGKRYHHILDPETGFPAIGATSVTVVHDNAGIADAAATALFIAGAEKWVEIAQSMGIRSVMLIDNRGKIHMSPAMAGRIHLKEENSDITLSEPL